MAMGTWEDFLIRLRRTWLSDTTATTNQAGWPDDDVLMDAFNDAQITFAQHTARPVEETVVANGTAYSFTLANEPMESLVLSGVVFSTPSASSFTRSYYVPDDSNDDSLFRYVNNLGEIVVVSPVPAVSRVMHFGYFTFWPEITTPADTIEAPQWARPALEYLTTANAMWGKAMTISNVVQWENAIERNPWRAQARALQTQYEVELARRGKQSREVYWRQP